METIAIDIAIAKEPLETIAIAIDSQFHYWPTLHPAVFHMMVLWLGSEVCVLFLFKNESPPPMYISIVVVNCSEL